MWILLEALVNLFLEYLKTHPQVAVCGCGEAATRGGRQGRAGEEGHEEDANGQHSGRRQRGQRDFRKLLRYAHPCSISLWVWFALLGDAFGLTLRPRLRPFQGSEAPLLPFQIGGWKDERSEGKKRVVDFFTLERFQFLIP